MKKILNGLRVFGSIILTLVLSVLIFLYVIVLNVKFLVSEKGMANTFKKIDVVETLKFLEDGMIWEDFTVLAESLDLSEEQFEQVLNNDKVKEQIGGYIGKVLGSIFNEKEVNLTKEDIEKFLNVLVNEYNKLSDVKISETMRKEIINSIDEEMIDDMNEEIGSINLIEIVAPEYVEYVKLIDNLLFGSYTLIMLVLIILIIVLIALFMFSYYKWMSYVKISTIISGSLMLIVGLFIIIIPLENMEIILPLRNLIVTRIFITSAILFIVSIGLSYGKKYLEKHIDKKKDVVTFQKSNIANERIEEVKQVEQKKKKIDKKTIIIIDLVLILLLVILFVIFRRNGSYTITFDTNGGTKIASIEVKNNEIVKLPEVPKKDGYKFVGWINEDGKVVTKGTKVTKDITLKAKWVSNDVETITIEYNTDGGRMIDNIIIKKGDAILLPVEPVKDGYIFSGWLDETDNFITEDTIMTNNITLKAMWIRKDAKKSTIKFNTDGGNKVESIVVEKGKIIVLPINPTKIGYEFVGWVDEDGNKVTKDTIVNENMTIKAIWKEPYTCPSGCTPIEDGSKCTKITTRDLVTYSGCPEGTETIEKFCSAHKSQVAVGFDEDISYVTAGIMCNDNPTGFCVDYNTRYTINDDSCPTGYYKYVDSDGYGAMVGCVKKYNTGGSSCPSGYTQNGNICEKTEIITCTAN